MLQGELGVSNGTLSRLLGVSVSTIVKRRAGKVSVSIEVILAMQHLILALNTKQEGGA